MWESISFAARGLRLKSAATRPAEEIKRVARSRLEELVAHAKSSSPFWRGKLSRFAEDRFELADLPTCCKGELMDNFDRSLTVDDIRRDAIEDFFGDESNLGKYFRGKYALSHTTGSQGQPLFLVQTREQLELLFALQLSRGNVKLTVREAATHFIWPARLAAVIFKPGFYPSASALQYLPAVVKNFVEVKVFNVHDEDMLDRLAEFRPTHLSAYASMLHEIAREIEAGRLSLKPHLEQVVNISERLIPQARSHYEKIFGAPVLDTYSMGECLFLTNGCPAGHGMHVNADWAILEVVDENNQPVPAGIKGAKVLITNLSNHVQPIIRYEIGDLVTMATRRCGCGNNLPLVDSVEGRDTDVFYIETEKGVRSLQPAVFDLAIGRMVDAREFQLIQEENTRFRILIEPLPGKRFDRDVAEKIMHQQLQKYGMDHRLDFKLEVVDHLGPEGDKKFKRVVSKVNGHHNKGQMAQAS